MQEWIIDIKLKPNQRKLCGGGTKPTCIYHKIPCKDVQNVFEFAKGFLDGALASKGVNLDNVVFFPADTIQYVNTPAKAIYCWEYKGLDGNWYYEFETTFAKGE